MKNLILKLVGIEDLLVWLGNWLSQTIKNEDSQKAKKIIHIVRRLNTIIDSFLEKFDVTN